MTQTPTKCRIYAPWMLCVLLVFAVCEGLFCYWGSDAVALAILGLFIASVLHMVRAVRCKRTELLEMIVPMLIALSLAMLVLPTLRVLRDMAHQPQCTMNLKELAVAVHNYHDNYRCLPPAYTVGESGAKLHSWRTLLLPYQAYRTAYEKINFAQPWNAKENQALACQFHAYQCQAATPPGSDSSINANYVAVVGEDTMWPPDGKSRKFDHVTAGLSNTVMLIEINNSNIPWHEPRDILLDDLISNHVSWSKTAVHPTRCSAFYEPARTRNIAMADGTIRNINGEPTPDQIRRMFSITEPFDPETELPFAQAETRPIVFRFAVFYIWIATLVMQFAYIFFPVPGKR